MSESLKGFSAVVVVPDQIRVKWDRITQADFAGVKIAWWCLAEPATAITALIWDFSQYFIAAMPGKTYVVAAQAYFRPRYAPSLSLRSPWAYVVVEVPQAEEQQYTDLGQVTVIDTPRGPAILLDGLWDACG